jgi:hypothetical protein
MACLADTCPIFGCRSHLPRPKSYAYESGRGSRHNSAIRLAKNVFNICTQTDIHRARLQCEVLTERYDFDCIYVYIHGYAFSSTFTCADALIKRKGKSFDH